MLWCACDMSFRESNGILEFSILLRVSHKFIYNISPYQSRRNIIYSSRDMGYYVTNVLLLVIINIVLYSCSINQFCFREANEIRSIERAMAEIVFIEMFNVCSALLVLDEREEKRCDTCDEYEKVCLYRKQYKFLLFP